MAEVHVIARAVAGKGKADQLKALLQGMLAPTHAEPGCRLYELYESSERGVFISTNCEKVRLRLSNTQRALTISTWN
jgi:quinol monooxygenase YgiN